MHGTIFAELQKYADHALGRGAFRAILDEAGLGERIYLPIHEYPDAEAIAIVGAAARRVGGSPGDVLEAFGAFIVPGLVEMYGALLRPEWSALDLVEHAEEAVHRALRRRGARPPYLSCTRPSKDELHVTYTSARRMCRLARGIVHGIARQKGEEVEIGEPRCMLAGDDRCVLVVRQLRAGARPL